MSCRVFAHPPIPRKLPRMSQEAITKALTQLLGQEVSQVTRGVTDIRHAYYHIGILVGVRGLTRCYGMDVLALKGSGDGSAYVWKAKERHKGWYTYKDIHAVDVENQMIIMSGDATSDGRWYARAPTTIRICYQDKETKVITEPDLKAALKEAEAQLTSWSLVLHFDLAPARKIFKKSGAVQFGGDNDKSPIWSMILEEAPGR